MGFFDDFKKRNNLSPVPSTTEAEDILYDARFNETERTSLLRILRKFPNVPLAVRSSAFGDARGTGIYESTFCTTNKSEEKNVDALEKAIKKVLLSEYSDSAAAFRKDLNLDLGIAIIVEPVFGLALKNIVGQHIYGPYYGGAAYSSTSSGKGYSIVCGGLPTNAVAAKGVKIFETEKKNLGAIAFSRMLDSELSVSEAQDYRLHERLTMGNCIDLQYGLASLEIPQNAIARRDLSWLFEKLKKLEKLLGKPQYVEWAAYEQNGQIHIAILQIADINPKLDFFEFAPVETLLIESQYVVGSGQKLCTEIVICNNPGEIALLKEYNRNHSNYALMYGGRLTSTGFFGPAMLQYSDLNNASVLVELPFSAHTSSPAEHFQGLLDTTSKILITGDKVN